MGGSAATSTTRRATLAGVAFACFVNLFVTTVALVWLALRFDEKDGRLAGVSATEDIVFPFVPILLLQAAVNGVVLAFRETSRRTGVGILIGTLAATLAAAVWFCVVLLTSFQ